MPKRQRKKSVHGGGSVYPRKDGRWVAKFKVEETGKYKLLYAKTEKEAYEKLRQAQHEQLQGTLVTGPQQTMQQYLEHWLDNVHKPSLKLSTYTRYHGLLHNNILPAIGHIQLQKLRAEHIEKLYAQMLKQTYAPRTVHIVHAVLHKALSQAVRRGYVAKNVCDLVSPPRKERYKVHPLTEAQAKQLVEAARGHPLEALILLAVTTGMRHGEMTGLYWDDINFNEGSVSVQRTLYYVNGIEGKVVAGFREAEPKTERSRRRIALPDVVLQALKEHQKRQNETRLARLEAGAEWQDRNLVFCNTCGGYLRGGRLLQEFHKLLDVVGLPHMRLHDLRHSAATILLAKGVHPKLVQELLGHSQISMTMDIYSHVMPSMQREMMDGWDDVFKEEKEEKKEEEDDDDGMAGVGVPTKPKR